MPRVTNASARTRRNPRGATRSIPCRPARSSPRTSAQYDFGERELYVRYLRDGPDAIYQYWDVPASEWDGLKLAGSKGSYINANIAYDYQYALFGRDDFPDRHALDSDQWRRFIYDP